MRWNEPYALILARNAPKCVWQLDSFRTCWGSLLCSPDPLAELWGGKGEEERGEMKRNWREGEKMEREGGEGKEAVATPKKMEACSLHLSLDLHSVHCLLGTNLELQHFQNVGPFFFTRIRAIYLCWTFSDVFTINWICISAGVRRSKPWRGLPAAFHNLSDLLGLSFPHPTKTCRSSFYV